MSELRSTLTEEEIKEIEESIGYEFKDKGLLIQAFTRRSYGKEKKIPDNELLEFIGDRALDFVITRRLVENSCEKEIFDNIEDDYNKRLVLKRVSVNKSIKWKRKNEDVWGDMLYKIDKPEEALTDAKKAIVSKRTLSISMKDLALNEYLIMNKADLSNKVYESESVQEDLLEAIIGAVAVDSKWNYKKIEDCIDNVLLSYVFDVSKTSEEEIVALTENYGAINYVQEWFQKNLNKLPNYEFERITTGENKGVYYCVLKICEKGLNIVASSRPCTNKKSAKNSAALDFVNMLSNYEHCFFIDYPITVRYEDIKDLDYKNLDKAVSILQELQQKGKIPELTYAYDNLFDSDGNPVWRCTIQCMTKDGLYERSIEPYTDSKKNAKKNTASALLDTFIHHMLITGELKETSFNVPEFYGNPKEYLYSKKNDKTFIVDTVHINGKPIFEPED